MSAQTYFLNRYKGQIVRFHLRQQAQCHGMLVDVWRGRYVVLVNSTNGFIFRYISFNDIQFISPCRGLTTEKDSYIPQLVYSNRN